MKITSWSYSKLKCYETCPRQFRYKYIDRVPEPPSPAMARGTEKHLQLEQYISGEAARLPKELSDSLGELRRDVQVLRKQPKAEAEVELAVDKRWRITSWTDPRAWLRAKFDVRAPDVHPTNEQIGTRIIDHKTGRERPAEHSEQLELYSVMEFSVNKVIDYVVGEIFYVDHGRKLSVLYNSRAFVLEKLRDRWEDRATTMLRDRKYPAAPGRGCRWCSFSREKGGPCDAG